MMRDVMKDLLPISEEKTDYILVKVSKRQKELFKEMCAKTNCSQSELIGFWIDRIGEFHFTKMK